MSLNRFSYPLTSERVHPFFLQDAIQEQNELNKRHLVSDYISLYWDIYSVVPSVEEIQEHFYKMDLDPGMINKLLKEF
jgi:hypothetical protein